MRYRQLALNVDLSAALAADQAQAPDWVELIPAGPNINGRDGRSWLFDDEAATSVQSIFAARGLDLPIDWNHALQYQAPNGGPSPAAGWIDRLEVRASALWGHVSWTPRGADSVTSREYRYLSPVFDYEPDTGRIVRLVSVALTNTPNLRLTALNSEETPVALSAAIAAALGLSTDATDEAAIAAVNQLKATATAANSEKSDLSKFVPRADYDQVMSRATNAETALADQRKAEHTQAVDAEIKAALQAGKITPATEAYHRASCSDTAGLERFREFVKAAAVVGAPSSLDGKTPPNTTTALNAEQEEIGKLFGLNADDFKKYGEDA